MNKFELEIVTPLGVTNHHSVNYMRCPGLDGSFGVMANHQEGMFAVDIGEVKISFDKSTYNYYQEDDHRHQLFATKSKEDLLKKLKLN
mgnify:CR=1 FL=1